MHKLAIVETPNTQRNIKEAVEGAKKLTLWRKKVVNVRPKRSEQERKAKSGKTGDGVLQ